MPRPKLIDRPKRVDIHLAGSIHSKMMMELYSDIEGRVPHGAISALLEELVCAWLKERGIAV